MPSSPLPSRRRRKRPSQSSAPPSASVVRLHQTSVRAYLIPRSPIDEDSPNSRSKSLVDSFSSSPPDLKKSRNIESETNGSRKRKIRTPGVTASESEAERADTSGNKLDQMPSRKSFKLDNGDVLGQKLERAFNEFVENSGTLQDWREVQIEKHHSLSIVGEKIKIYWDGDMIWYHGEIFKYNETRGSYGVKYDDGSTSEENLSGATRVRLFLNAGFQSTKHQFKYGCMSEGLPFLPGQIVWGRVKGYAAWPAIVLSDMRVDGDGTTSFFPRCALRPTTTKPISIQFFGSHEFSALPPSQVIHFLEGVAKKLHTKGPKKGFPNSIDHLLKYFSTFKLPVEMGGTDGDDYWTEIWGDDIDTESEYSCDQEQLPLHLNKLVVESLGNIIPLPKFHNERYIYPVGYRVNRQFFSATTAGKKVWYECDIVDNSDDKNKDNPKSKGPIFRITPPMGHGNRVVSGSATGAWKQILQQMSCTGRKHTLGGSGNDLFGLRHPAVERMIQQLPKATECFLYKQWTNAELKRQANEFVQTLKTKPHFQSLNVQWQHSERCSVCYDDEELDGNLLVQCDSCRMLVHMTCYGVHELPEKSIWMCDVCQALDEAPTAPRPFCALCPVEGGAMKKTTCGGWAHITCALWIPDTSIVCVNKMGPIDGIKNISKERWRLECSLCKISHGAAIQCCIDKCCVAFHPLCARAAGQKMDIVEKDSADDSKQGRQQRLRGHVEILDQEGGNAVQLRAYCQRHSVATKPKSAKQQTCVHSRPDHAEEERDSCARMLPFSKAKKPSQSQAVPYSLDSQQPGLTDLKQKSDQANLLLSRADRFQGMKDTVRKRVMFGKSDIHGWGVFARQMLRAGDMIIEYIGHTMRGTVADVREKNYYDKIVGAGTYIFRISDNLVIDATKSGNIASLINHSCAPNCASKVETIAGEDHVVIFAKRSIPPGEELTYDYRFEGKEKLECCCRSIECRGFVNACVQDKNSDDFIVSRKELQILL